MAIRITGMYSGLDTESIINELASAQSYKKNKLVKAQTKLSWKQDAWKALNTKIYSFYQKLDDLRLQSSYLKKKTVVSNPSAIQVSGGSVNGSHKVSVEKLSQQATLTSGSLAKGNTYYTGAATLKQLGFTGTDGSIRLSDAAGNYVDVNVSADMKINDFVKAIEDNTALKASFDQDNQRIYLSSWASGKEGEFFLTGNDAGGMEALKTLKLMSQSDIDVLTQEGGEYYVWSKYVKADLTATSPTYSRADYEDEYKKLIADETLNRLKAMKAQNDSLAKDNKACDEANQKNRDKLKEILDDTTGKYDAYKPYVTYSDAMTAADMKRAGENLFKKIYGEQDTETDGTPKVDADGKPVMKNGMVQDLEGLQDTLKTEQEALQQARKDLEADSSDPAKQQAVKDAEERVANASEAVSKKQDEINKAKEVYSVYSAFDQNESQKNANLKTIGENEKRFTYSKTGDVETYQELDENGDPVTDMGAGITGLEVAAQFDARVKEAQEVMKSVRNPDGSLNTGSSLYKDAQGVKVSGEDAKITVDGVGYTSSTDTLSVNGMTITALEETGGKSVTVSTKNDTEGVYNMIKDFIKSYSELINEMDSLYNAESAKDYEPLLSEEKEALTDTEVEEWEKKIKDSLLRRDSTLSSVASALKMDMMKGFQIGGQTIYLSDFGISTLGYFNSADNEKNAYHIDGDPDDAKTKNNTDLLTSLINNNPDAVMEFFTGLTNTLHDTLADKMSATKMSSAMTVYNDKKMKEEYDDYTDKIKQQEEKLNAYIDKWYSKFSAMETALAKLESKNNSLTSLFGG